MRYTETIPNGHFLFRNDDSDRSGEFQRGALYGLSEQRCRTSGGRIDIASVSLFCVVFSPRSSLSTGARMSSDGGLKVAPANTVESLTREAELLKAKLEEERQKLNDVTRKYLWALCRCPDSPPRPSVSHSARNFLFSVSTVADKLEIITFLNIKLRRILKGHQAKVLCSDWSPDKRHIVSSSQVSAPRVCVRVLNIASFPKGSPASLLQGRKLPVLVADLPVLDWRKLKLAPAHQELAGSAAVIR